ncbi:MFS transporter [Salmonella enterica subsp. enterica]|nr:MFS transporter [Salmonella enterica]EBY0806006.1 MFS transporter [Salmonella enterica subsp. enterica serovar Berlin]ECF3780122.1 MFS transporter [Salmonella enterica subsp. enterica serovar Oslo]EDR2105428.1 MFS transporter [Salmonella enterica subsp. enterica]EDW0612382.1 MFS transporter [Salmonella enterica subsp. enterica serovar Ball]EGZ4377632.1 MFS transporter [Salmonella enterica subsp. enterica serovar Lexington]
MVNTSSQGAQPATRVRWKIFSIIFLLVVVNLVDRVSLSIGMPTIAKEFNLSPTMQGVILSSFFWAYALLQLPGGWMIDRFGPRKIITGSTLFWGIFQTLAAFATGGMSLLITRVALGAAEAPLFPAGGKLNATWLSSRERGRGAVIMDCGGPLGAALGGLVIAHLIAVLGSWRLVFAIAGIATVVLSWVAWRYLRDQPHLHPATNQAERDHIQHVDVNAPDDDFKSAQGGRFGLPARSLVSILVGRAAWAMMFFGLLTWGPNYLSQARGFDLIAIGNATFFIFMSGVAGSLCGGFLMDALVKAGYSQGKVLKGLLLISGAIALIAFISLPSLANAVMAVAVLSLAAFFLMWGSLYWSLPPLLVARNKVGIMGGAMNMAGSIGGISVPIVVGLLLQASGGYQAVLWFFAGCSLVYMVGSFCISLQPRVGGNACITAQ